MSDGTDGITSASEATTAREQPLGAREQVLCDTLIAIAFAPKAGKKPSTVNFDDRHYNQIQLRKRLERDRRFQQQVATRYFYHPNRLHCLRLVKLAFGDVDESVTGPDPAAQPGSKSAPPAGEAVSVKATFSFQDQEYDRQSLFEALHKFPDLQVQVAASLRYGPNEEYCERLIQVEFGVRGRIRDGVQPGVIGGKTFTRKELIEQMLRDPKLQQQVAAKTHYTPSKWLLEQEMKWKGEWPDGEWLLNQNLAAVTQPGKVPGGWDDLPDVFKTVSKPEKQLTGVCFSGGGIRSATFNLGVLQGFAELGIFPQVDYLSSVSGGGYIHEFLAGWILREPGGQKSVMEQMIPQAEPGCPPRAPEPIKWLMRYASYLTPVRGLFSTDTWTMLAIWFRNTVLNQVPILTGIACCFLIVHLLIPAPLDWKMRAREILPALEPWGVLNGLAWSGVAALGFAIWAVRNLGRNLNMQRRMARADGASRRLKESATAVKDLVDSLFAWTKKMESLVTSSGLPEGPLAPTADADSFLSRLASFARMVAPPPRDTEAKPSELAALRAKLTEAVIEVSKLSVGFRGLSGELNEMAAKVSLSGEEFSSVADALSSSAASLCRSMQELSLDADQARTAATDFLIASEKGSASAIKLEAKAYEVSNSAKTLATAAAGLKELAHKVVLESGKEPPHPLLTNAGVQSGIILPWLSFSVWFSFWAQMSGYEWSHTLGPLLAANHAAFDRWLPWVPVLAAALMVLAAALLVIYAGGAVGASRSLAGVPQEKKWTWPQLWFALAGIAATAVALAIGFVFVWASGWLSNRLSMAGPVDGLPIDAWRIRLTLLPGALLSVPYVAIELTLGLLGRDYVEVRREWLARLRAWSLLYAVLWTSMAGLVFLGPYSLYYLTGKGLPWLYSSIAAFMVAHGTTILSGWSGNGDGKPTDEGILGYKPVDLIALVAAPFSIAGMMIMLTFAVSWGVDALFAAVRQQGGLWAHFWWVDGVAIIATAAVALLFGWRIDINEFSMQSFYRNRLSRCYLGATVPDRQADPFTGFDERTTVTLADGRDQKMPPRVSDLLPDRFNRPGNRKKKYDGPFPIFCTTLNLTTGEDLATQERKGTSFAFTPLYSGYSVSWTDGRRGSEVSYNGYVPTNLYAYNDGGIHLDTAVAISGAAVNPNMGYNSNPALAFLMTFFNVRLGWWISNTRFGDLWRASGSSRITPRFAGAYLFKELVGKVNDAARFVNLSDGGHFENMGLYELVRRRCNYIVVCDAEADAEMQFLGMSMAITRCRADFGAEIDLDLRPLQLDKETGMSKTHCVVGTITYPPPPEDAGSARDDRQVDRKDKLKGATLCPCLGDDGDDPYTGVIVYMKSSLVGDEPADLLAYKLRHAVFPHDMTANQWFTETQFESYRRLGHHVSMSAFQPALPPEKTGISSKRDIPDLFKRMYSIWYPPTPEMQTHLADHLRLLEAILNELRTHRELAGLEARLNDETPWHRTDTLEWLAPKDPVGSGEYATQFAHSLLSFMYTVYVNLQLAFPDNRVSPHAEWWICMFRRWCRVTLVRDTWKTHISVYAAEFRLFAQRELRLPAQPCGE